VATLSLRGVHKRYGSVHALRELELEVADGELLVLVGPSGCGKTTALRVTAGLEGVTAGSVHIGGRDVTRLAPAERNVAMVFQNYALFPHMTVAGNIGIGLKVRRVPNREANERIRTAAALVGCQDQLDRKPHQLSGGERQRVALARAMVREPDVFLLDEPLSNLDAQLRVQTRAELQRLHQRLGTTMLYVTHDQIEALTMGDRVAVLRGGVLQQLAPPEDIYQRPANRFVASFIGSPAMNLLPARTCEGWLQVGPFRLDRPPNSWALNGQRLELGIRPEHLRVSRGGLGVPAEVQVVEVAGNETFLHLATGGHRLVARVSFQYRARVGEQVRVQIPQRQFYLFDADSGQTLVQAT
jgi:ABC-type sugar transport system ATPase subunit